MLIRDLEQKTGLDRATIRFYEKEGLISPARRENGYRTYSEADLDTLLKIKLLRQLGFPLEKIRQLQQGSGALSAALTEQIQKLDAQMNTLNRAREVCKDIRETGTSYQDLDAEYYLRQLSSPTRKPEFREPVRREYHPWRRFLARMLDYQLMSVLLRFLLIVVFRVRPFGDFLSAIIAYGVPFLMIPVNAWLLHICGTTPGKWVFKLRVQSENGGNLSFSAAADREWHVLHRGLGFGIPVWEYWRLYQSYKAYGEEEPEWDWASEYIYEKWTIKRRAAMVTAVAITIAVTIFNAADSMKPKYRGELTIAQFAENYNYYYGMVNETVVRSDRMQSDGTWYPESDGSVTIYIGGQPETARADFTYETENGILRRIRFKNRWTDVFYQTPITAQCQTAAMTALLSQKGTGMKDVQAFSELWDAEQQTPDGEILYKNVEIRWHIESENCRSIDSGTYLRIDENQESSISIEFEIIIHE